MSVHTRVARRVSGFITDYLLALPVGCAAALLWANTLPDSYYRFAHAAAWTVNDIGMVFFFALITKEVAEATIPGGALHPLRRAAVPVAAAAGAVNEQQIAGDRHDHAAGGGGDGHGGTA